jgi:hypothetical protein
MLETEKRLYIRSVIPSSSAKFNQTLCSYRTSHIKFSSLVHRRREKRRASTLKQINWISTKLVQFHCRQTDRRNGASSSNPDARLPTHAPVSVPFHGKLRCIFLYGWLIYGCIYSLLINLWSRSIYVE